MATATQILETDRRIQGEPANFDQLKNHFDRVGNRVVELEQELGDIRFGDSTEFRGEAAEAFRTQIAAFDDDLDKLIDITRDLERIFADHAADLRRLRREADSALARAKTDWLAWHDAEADRRDAERNVDWLEHQLAQVIDATGTEATRLEGQITYYENCVDDARYRETRSLNALEQERTTWNRLVDEEQDLIDRTIGSLKGIDLGGLADPGLIDQFFHAAAGAVSFVVELGDAFGDWVRENQDFLYYLYEFLEDAATVLTVIMLVAAVLTPIFPALAVVVGALHTVLVLIAVLKFATGLALWSFTDKPIGLVDVVVDGIFAAVAVGGVGKMNAKVGVTDDWFKVTRKYKHAGRIISRADGLYMKDGLKQVWHHAARNDAIVSGMEKAYGVANDGFDAFNISDLWSVKVEPHSGVNRHLCSTGL